MGGDVNMKKAAPYLSYVKEAFSNSGAKVDQTGQRLHDRIAMRRMSTLASCAAISTAYCDALLMTSPTVSHMTCSMTGLLLLTAAVTA